MAYELDDVWLENFKNTDLSLTQKRRLYRVIVVFAIWLFYSIDSLIIFLFYKADTVSIDVFLTFISLTLMHLIIFTSFYWSGFSERFRNPHMSIWQMICGVVIIIITMNLAPKIISYFLALIFIIFTFATIRISFKESLLVWLLTTVAVTINLYFLEIDSFGIQNPTHFERVLIISGFSFILLRIILLGYYHNILREKLFIMNNKLESESKYDTLTKIYNRKTILNYYDETIELVKRNRLSFSIVMVDIDHFKQINDNYGHPVGDVILYEIGQFLNNNIRNIDKVGRYGGEEFLLILQSSSLEEATVLMERVRYNLSQKKWKELNNSTVTISCGIHFINSDNIHLDALTLADEALYEAKRAGRNRVFCSTYLNSKEA